MPCSRVILKLGAMSFCAAIRPRQTITGGCSRAVSARRYCMQASCSSGRGSRLPGGWHFTILVINTSLRLSPADVSRMSSTLPAGPTKGIPCKSSCLPGASATSIICAAWLPLPGTAFLRVCPNAQRPQLQIIDSISFQVCMSPAPFWLRCFQLYYKAFSADGTYQMLDLVTKFFRFAYGY